MLLLLLPCCRRLQWSVVVVVVVTVAFLCLCVKGNYIAGGSGRAIPLASENYVIQNFQEINPRLEWDHTNFLIDLSGQYANCHNIDTNDFIKVPRLTPEGQSIIGYVDSTHGDEFHVNAVVGYLETIINRWMRDGTLSRVIQGARRFGCSVRTGCRGRVSFGCLFSPGNPNGSPATRGTMTTYAPSALPISQKELPSTTLHIESPKSQAFTDEQRELTKKIMSSEWDRYLENLSGQDMDCEMIGSTVWKFPQMHAFASGRNLHAAYGSSPNTGQTQPAMENVLKNISSQVVRANKFGCSVIPDCRIGHQNLMIVVVSCVYEV